MDHIRGLRYGRLSPQTVHICVDMQMLFAKDSPWASGAVAAALPATKEICRRKSSSTIFTRFICPPHAGAATGQWRRFYAQCPQVLNLDPRLFDVVPDLRGIAGDAAVCSRSVFSAFHDSNLEMLLRKRSAEALVLSGVETDICVLSTVMRAIDIGYRVIVVEEAVASSNREGHIAALAGIFPRFDQQVELIGIEETLRSWA